MNNYRQNEEMNCFNCIHADVCAFRKGVVRLQPVYSSGCGYHQLKLSEFAVAISKEEYEIFLRMKNIFQLYSKEEVDYKVNQARMQAVKEFVEKLKFDFECDYGVFYFRSTIENRIDKIAKVMGVNIKE